MRCRICDSILNHEELKQEEYDVCFVCKDRSHYIGVYHDLEEEVLDEEE